MSDRQPMPGFSVDLGHIETNTLSNTEVDNFLGADPEDITPVEKVEETPPTPNKVKTPPVKKQPSEDPETPSEEPESPEVGADVLEEDEEVKEVKENKQKKEKEKESIEEEAEDVNVFESISKELTSLGIFSSLEEEPEIKDGIQLRDRFNLEIQNRVQDTIDQFIGRFGEDFQAAFDAIYLNGVNPKEYFQQQNKIEDLSELDLSIVANQKLVLREYFKNMGLPNDKIEERVQKAEDRGDLEDDASSFHQILVQKEQQELQAAVARKQQEQYQKQQFDAQYRASIKKIINEKAQSKEFDSIPVDPKFAQQVDDYLTQNKYRLSNGDLITDFDMDILNLRKPENYEKKVKIAMLMKMIETDPKFTKLQKVAVSKESNKLFQDLTKKKKVIQKEGEDTTAYFKF